MRQPYAVGSVLNVSSVTGPAGVERHGCHGRMQLGRIAANGLVRRSRRGDLCVLCNSAARTELHDANYEKATLSQAAGMT